MQKLRYANEGGNTAAGGLLDHPLTDSPSPCYSELTLGGLLSVVCSVCLKDSDHVFHC